MKRSDSRILTTHTGSLPRPDELVELLVQRDSGNLRDLAALDALVATATKEVVQRQHDLGIDVVNDGECGKPDYSTYIKHRLTGFGGPRTPMPIGRDILDFPDFARRTAFEAVPRPNAPMCNGPIDWKDFAAVEKDIANLKAATAGLTNYDVFMTAASPGQVARFHGNQFYDSDEEYLWALGEVLRDEYEAITTAGFVLQVDCPDLASGWHRQFNALTVEQFIGVIELHLEVLDDAIKNIPPEQVRLHLCWGNAEGPHNHDIPLREIIEPVLRSRPVGIVVEGANPRHEHEWIVFQDVKLPEDKVLIPGVIDSTTNFIEHPEVVAQRIERFASVVGRENVIAGTDCGFATLAAAPSVVPEITWAKLASLVEGARIASSRLW